MAGKVFFSVSMSLDGYIAPPSLDQLMGPPLMELQRGVFPQRLFRENLKFGEGGEEGRDNEHPAGDVRTHGRQRDGEAHVRWG